MKKSNKIIGVSILSFFVIIALGFSNAVAINKTSSIDRIADFRVGDFIFQSTSSGQGQAIKLATNSEFTHVGLIIREDHEWKVIEAVQPVKITGLKEFISHGDDYKFVTKRLKLADSILTKENTVKLITEGKKYLNKDYDIYFNWDDTQIYCSELVYKMYDNALNIKVGKTHPLSYYNLKHPIVKETMAQRYGNDIPYDEPMISPQDIFESKKLFTVIENL